MRLRLPVLVLALALAAQLLLPRAAAQASPSAAASRSPLASPDYCRVALVAGGDSDTCAAGLGSMAGFSGTGGIVVLPASGADPNSPASLLYTDQGTDTVRSVRLDNSFLGRVARLSGTCDNPDNIDDVGGGQCY